MKFNQSLSILTFVSWICNYCIIYERISCFLCVQLDKVSRSFNRCFFVEANHNCYDDHADEKHHL